MPRNAPRSGRSRIEITFSTAKPTTPTAASCTSGFMESSRERDLRPYGARPARVPVVLPAGLAPSPVRVHPVHLHQEIPGADLHVGGGSVGRGVGGAEVPGA